MIWSIFLGMCKSPYTLCVWYCVSIYVTLHWISLPNFLQTSSSHSQSNIRYLWDFVFNFDLLQCFFVFELNFFECITSFIPEKLKCLVFKFSPLMYRFISSDHETFGIHKNIQFWSENCALETCCFFTNLIPFKKGLLKIVGISDNVCSLKILFISHKVSL